MSEARNKQQHSPGSLIAKLLASSALVLASGAYVFSQQASQAPGGEASTAPPRLVARVQPPAPQAPSIATAPEPAPAEKTGGLSAKESAMAAPPAREQAGEETAPSDIAPPPDAAVPPAAPLATPQAEPPPPAVQTNVAALPPPRRGLADGDYTGDPADCQWGTVQVAIHVQGGAVEQVNFLQVPDHRRRSAEISDWTTPILAQEAIKTQNDNVDLVSGATATSMAFQQAFSNALTKAKR